MDQQKSEILTQDGLVAALHKLGYTDVTKRRLASWRENDLLPPFDLIGGGRGRHRGRKSNGWEHGDYVLNLAVWVYELLKFYKSFDDLYVPLWLLGYAVPLHRVRHALGWPLNAMARSIETDVESKGDLEDLIGDAAFVFTKDIRSANMALLEVPQETLEALTNLFFNSEYDLNDLPFEEGIEALRGWEQTFQQRCEAIFGDEAGTAGNCSIKPDDGLKVAFTHATFINKFFSLEQLKTAVNECTDEDLVAVWNDMHALREIVLLFRQVISLLLPHIPDEMDPTTMESLAAIFRFGRMCIWADLSLRRSGYGEIIDYCLPALLDQIREELNDDVLREWAAAGPEISAAVENCFQKLTVAVSP